MEVVVLEVEGKTAKQAGADVTVEMPQDTAMEKMVKMERQGESECLCAKHMIDFVLIFTNSGGYGSSGADGAAGGNVFVTVHEEDTDLLLPLEYNVSGGAGGNSGEHGEPGDGGTGGLGGEGHVWYVGKRINSVSVF